ncbi:hypothetical protein GOODEAATRI_026535 [Goodea atripinnis]|uniref:RSE1/DDB1/CPSF1 C-terminal domain-containing protein n=1 Tax=Goodea atripinnis TaxID=208336 RepID=A0ABV0PHF0_9TELE
MQKCCKPLVLLQEMVEAAGEDERELAAEMAAAFLNENLPEAIFVEDVPLAIAPFQGRILVGVGKLLRIYDLGKKKLLRKCENKDLPHAVHQFYAVIYCSSDSVVQTV